MSQALRVGGRPHLLPGLSPCSQLGGNVSEERNQGPRGPWLCCFSSSALCSSGRQHLCHQHTPTPTPQHTHPNPRAEKLPLTFLSGLRNPTPGLFFTILNLCCHLVVVVWPTA